MEVVLAVGSVAVTLAAATVFWARRKAHEERKLSRRKKKPIDLFAESSRD